MTLRDIIVFCCSGLRIAALVACQREEDAAAFHPCTVLLGICTEIKLKLYSFDFMYFIFSKGCCFIFINAGCCPDKGHVMHFPFGCFFESLK